MMSLVDQTTLQEEEVDNIFHTLLQGLLLIREASKISGAKVKFFIDDGCFIVGPVDKLAPNLNTHHLEAIGFVRTPMTAMEAWIFDSLQRQRGPGR